ncbi:MAG: hypothetical protein AAFV53_07380 [Myxococcota bacterium]
MPRSSDDGLHNTTRDALDITLKSLWRTRPEGLIRFATGNEELNLLRVLDASPIVIRRSVDGVALVADNAGTYIEHMEFETSADGRALADRVYVYSAHLYTMMGHRYPVRSTVVLLEDRLPRFKPVFIMKHGEQEICRYQFRVIRLADLEPERFLDEPARAVLVPFAKGADLHHVEAARHLIEKDASVTQLPELLAALYIVAGRRFDASQVRDLLWSDVVMESSTYKEIEARGFERGIERGIERALERHRSQLLQMMNLRFGEIPEKRHKQVRAATEDEVEQWMLNLLNAATVEDVFTER